MISLKLRKSPTSGKCSPCPASCGCVNAATTMCPRSLLSLVRALFPGIGSQKTPLCSGKRGFQSFRAIQIRQYDFVSQLRMLGRIARQRAYLELTARLQRAYDGAALKTGCADDGDELFSV